MAPSKGWGGDPAEGEESVSVSRCARSDGICPTRRHPDDEARSAAHTPAARTAGEGGSRRLDMHRRVVPGEMRGKSAPADGVQEAVPTCGCLIERYGYHDTVPRRPVSVGEGTSAAGAEEAVPTCGSYTDTIPRRPTPVSASTALGIKGGRGGRGLKNKCDEMRVEVSRGGVPTDGFEESVARCGFRNPRLVRRCPTLPGRDATLCAQMGAAASCIPVATGARGGGGGRGHRDTHDYAGTSRPRAAVLHAPTADLPAEKIGFINNTLDAAAIQAARKADLKGNVSKLEDQLREAKKKMGKENIQKAVKTAIDAAEAAVSEGKLFCVTHTDVGLDTTAVREAVVKAMDRFKDPETRKPRVNIRSDKETGRDEDKKRLGTISEEVKQLAQRARDNTEANNSSSTSASTKTSASNTIQILVKFCGSTIPVRENLNMLSANMLIEHVCQCAGVKPTDLYSTSCGRILEPNQVLSYYQLQKDSMVYINPRLRGGSAGHKNWDAVIINLDRYHSVGLPWDLLLPSQTKIYPAVKVWYLDHLLQVRCRKVLIYLGRKHYSGISFGGFTSKQILFDADGNVHIDAAPRGYSQEFALLDYSAVSGIFDDALGAGINKYPTYFYHLIDFLSDNGPAVDCRSKAVIAFVTNHVSLLTHSQRIQISAVLDMLLTRLSKDDSEALIAILENFYWGSRLKKVPAMYHTYFFHWWYDTDGNICTPYKDNGVSLLRFSNNFFKHHTAFPLEQRDAAFALATKHKNYLPQLLCSILITFKDPNKPCPPSVQAFIDEVIEMLGDHTVDCEIVQAN